MPIIHSFSNTDNKKVCSDSSSEYYVTHNNSRYLDFISGLYNCPLGSSVKSIKKSITDALEELPNSHLFSIYPGLSQTNRYAEDLQTILKELIPFGKYLIYTNSGAEAAEVGLAHCLTANKRKKIMSYRNSYHGSTYLTNQVSGNVNTFVEDRVYVEFYDYDSSLSKQEYLKYIEDTILANDPISSFIIEPMIGASGGFLMKENILPEICKICKKYDILIILDEVISGFGRLGEMFAFEKYQIKPDVLLLSKQITNGYMPLGVCILSDRFDLENVDIKTGSTMAGNPASCAAAISSIMLIQQLHTSRKQVEQQLYSFKDKLESCPGVYKFNHSGCFASIHFSQKKDSLELFDYNIGGKISKMCYSKGLIIRGNPKSIILAPGYQMSPSQISFAMDTIINSINELLV